MCGGEGGRGEEGFILQWILVVFPNRPRGWNGNHPLARAVQWHGARAALHGLGDGAAVCVRLWECHRIWRSGVVLIEIPGQAVARD